MSDLDVQRLMCGTNVGDVCWAVRVTHKDGSIQTITCEDQDDAQATANRVVSWEIGEIAEILSFERVKAEVLN